MSRGIYRGKFRGTVVRRVNIGERILLTWLYNNIYGENLGRTVADSLMSRPRPNCSGSGEPVHDPR
jgi:hypothetical protein